MHGFHITEGLAYYHRLRRGGNLGASPPMVLATGFLALILLGTVLLALPFAAKADGLSWFQAFFTATAAVTVTGLAIVEYQQLTLFGQWVVILLVQIGGLGFVTLAVVSAIKLGHRLTLRQQSLALEAFNQTNTARLRNTAVAVLRITIFIELTATLLLFLWWWGSGQFTAGSALFHAFFHAVAAFNNAGLPMLKDSLMPFLGDGVTITVLSVVIILGGIGFPVIVETIQKKRWRELRPYARLIILSTLLLNLFGLVGLWVLEAGNQNTLGTLSWGNQAAAAWMQSVSLRTAGFSVFDFRAVNDSTALLSAILMFIGGASMSTAGGIKLGTFVVIMAAVFAYVTQRKEVVLMKRSVSSDTVQKALAVVVVTVITAALGLFLLTVFETKPFVSLMLEVIGALSTTGLTHGITAELSTPGQCVLAVLMFMGRIGPLTLVYSLATRQRSRVRYPEMEFQVG